MSLVRADGELLDLSPPRKRKQGTSFLIGSIPVWVFVGVPALAGLRREVKTG
jgi:hypothetical protein